MALPPNAPRTYEEVLGPYRTRPLASEAETSEQAEAIRKQRRQERREQLRQMPSPDAMARAQSVAREGNVPVSSVVDTLDTAERDLAIAKTLQWVEKSAALGKAFLGDPVALSMVQGGEKEVSTIESVLSGLKEFAGKAPGMMAGPGLIVPAQEFQSVVNEVGYRAGYVSLPIQYAMQSFIDAAGLPGAGHDPYKELLEQKQKADGRVAASLANADRLREKNSSDNYFVNTALSGLEFIPASFAAAVTRNPKAGASAIGGLVGAIEFREAREQGMSFNEAVIYSVPQGVIEFATERNPIGILGDVLTRKVPVGKGLLRAGWQEQVGEQQAQHFQDYVSWTMLPDQRNKSFGDYLAERPEAALSAFIATLSQSAVTSAITAAPIKTYDGTVFAFSLAKDVRDALTEGRSLRSVFANANTSVLRRRSTEKFEAVMRSLSDDYGVSSILIDGQAARAYMQSDEYDAATDPMEEYRQQVEDAAAAGNDVAVPIERAVTSMAGTKAYEVLQDDMRFTAGQMTPRQAREITENWDDIVQQADASAIKSDDDFASNEEYVEGLVDKLTTKLVEDGLMDPTQARRNAELHVAATIQRDEGAGNVERELARLDVRRRMPPELQRAMEADERDMVFKALRGKKKGSTSRARAAAEELAKELRRSGLTAKELNDEQLSEFVERMANKALEKENDGNRIFKSGRGRTSDRDGTPLADAPKIKGEQFGPITEVVSAAQAYAEQAGIEFGRQAEYVDVDPEFAKRLADAYEAMEHAPNDPAVAEAYANLIEQTRAQYDALVAAGFTFTFGNPDSGYFASGFNALRDLRDNKTMQVFATRDGYGQDGNMPTAAENPMMAETGIEWADQEGNMHAVLANDLFRAVHDAFGHGLEGAGFRARGEENAWQAHSRLFTGSAVAAITSETRGQNSWVNYGPKGEANQTASAEDTDYADQKIGLLPEWAWTENVVPDEGALPDTIEIDGVERSTTNSEGMPLAQTEEGVRNFWAWFGDSEVVDDQGKPLVVYHRTSADFDQFEGDAIYFGRDPQNLPQMHNRRAEGDRIIPAYLAASNNLVLDEFNRKEMQGRWAGGSKEFPFVVSDETRGALMKAGFNGVIVEDIYGEGDPNEYVVFDPTQIKSINNSGQFDPADPRILHQGEAITEDADGNQSIGWTPSRIRDLLSSYGYNPDFTGFEEDASRTKAYAVRLSPDQFLGLTASEKGRELIAERVEGEGYGGEIDFDRMRGELQAPFLVVSMEGGKIGVNTTIPESLRVVGHEGRHRMTMLKKAGIESVPVVIVLRDKNKPPTESDMKASPQRSRSDQVSTGNLATMFEGMEPISYANREALAEKFGTGRELFQEGGRPTIRGAAEEWTAEHNAIHGGPLTPIENEEHYQIVLEGLLADYQKQIDGGNDGSSWYNSDVADALNVTQEIIPELADPINREVFLLLAAITSPQRNPVDNWELAVQAMQGYLRDGRVPVKKDNGKNFGVPSTGLSLSLFQHMIDTMGLQEAVAWLAEPHTGAEVAAVRRDSGVYTAKPTLAANTASDFPLKATKVGAYIFGPKVGPFASNIAGLSQDAVTVDIWAYRTYARHSGRLLEDAQESSKSGVAEAPTSARGREVVQRLMTDVASEAGVAPSTVQAVLWYSEQGIYREKGIKSLSRNFSDGSVRAAEVRGIGADRITQRLQERSGASQGERDQEYARSYDQATIFYSALERAAESVSTARAPAQQWIATLKKAPGVKAEELDSTGIINWLEIQKGPVEKEQVLKVLRSGGIVVREVIHNAPVDDAARQDYARRLNEYRIAIDERDKEIAKRAQELEDEWEFARQQELIEDFIDTGYYVEEVTEDEEGEALEEPKYRVAQEGGYSADTLYDTEDEAREDMWENYSGPAEAEYIRDVLNSERGRQDFEQDAEYEIAEPEEPEEPGADNTRFRNWTTDPSSDSYRELLITLPPAEGGNPDVLFYERNHWGDQANVLVHLRFMDKAGPNGERILFIEEVQATTHQKGREEGYAVAASKEEIIAAHKRVAQAGKADKEAEAAIVAEALRLVAAARKDNAEDVWLMEHEAHLQGGVTRRRLSAKTVAQKLGAEELASDIERTWLELREAERALSNLLEPRGVPDIPFKKTWPDLAMKRAIIWAAANGYDQIAWTWGAEQAKRYNLTEAVGTITASRDTSPHTAQGRYHVVLNNGNAATVIADNIDGVTSFDNHGELSMTEAQMKEAFGADITKKIVEGVPEAEAESVDRISEARAKLTSLRNKEDGILLAALEGNSIYDEAALTAATDARLQAERDLREAEQSRLLVLRDTDLNVGGEGMKQFYDKNLVNITNKLVKKYGAKVRIGDVVDATRTRGQVRAEALRDRLGLLGYGIGSREQAEQRIAAWEKMIEDGEGQPETPSNIATLREALPFIDELVAMGKPTVKQPMLDITPELREAAGNGFPLFQPDHKDGPRARILFADNTSENAVIELFENSNASSLPHELGHLYLEQLKDDALKGASPRRTALWEETLAWFKSQGYEVRNGIIPVGAHEMWARGYERYLREGKAPSPRLKSAFEAFKNWLTMIYEKVVSLRAPITPEIRSVFDRLLASDAEIAEAREVQAIKALFDSAMDAGMSEGEWQNFQEQVEDAKAEASGKVLERVMVGIKKRETALGRERRAEKRGQIAALVEEQPFFRALAMLRDQRMDRETLEELAGEGGLDSLPTRVPPIYAKSGIDPELVAEQAGYLSAQAMVEDMQKQEAQQRAAKESGDDRPMKERIIDTATDQAMDAEYGAPMTKEQIAEEARSAIHNEKQGEVFASEIGALSRMTGRKPTPWRVAREWARERVRGGSWAAEGSPAAIQRHRRAVTRAGREAEAALLAGDKNEAQAAKQRQMLSSALLMEAKQAGEEVEKARERMSKIANKRTMRSVDQDYLEQAHAMLEAVDLKERSQTFLNRKGRWQEWADAQEAEGRDVVTPQSFESLIGETNWSRLPIEQLLTLDEAIGQVIHFGRMKQRLYDNKEARDYAEVKAEIRAVATEVGKKEPKSDFSEDGLLDAIKSGVLKADAALLKMETLFDWLDNGNKNGAFNRYIFRPIASAASRERDMLRDFYGAMKENFESIDAKTLRSWATKIEAPWVELKTGVPPKLTRKQIVAMALNWGNAGNRQRLVDGYGLREAQVEQFLMDTLTEQEWQFVQRTWDIIGGLWPELAAMERRVEGVEPEKIEATSFQTPYGTMKGGYYPAIYNTKIDRKAMQHMEESADLYGAKTTKASTRSSSAKERSEEVKRPILLDLGVINRHVGEVIHDITHREAVIQANRLLSDPEVLDEVDAVLGREYSAQFRPWIKYIANQWAHERAGNEGFGKFFTRSRANATVVGMAFRFSTMMTQTAGYSNSVEYLGKDAWRLPEEIAKLSAQITGSGGKLALLKGKETPAMVAFVHEKSGEMRHRMDTIDRDINQTMRAMMMPKHRRAVGAALTSAQVFGFHGIGYMDMMVSVPTWVAAYNGAISREVGEEQAIYEADKAVRLSQGTADAKDLAAVQRGTGRFGEIFKWMTMYYTYMGTFYQRQRNLGRDTRSAISKRDLAAFPALLARAWFLLILPPVLAELLAMRGPDEEEDWALWAFRKIIGQSLGPIPVARDLWEPTWAKIAGEPSFGYRFSPAVGGYETLTNVAGDAGRIVRGEETTRATRNSLELIGYSTGLVPGQLASAAQFLVNVGEGEEDPQGAGEWFEGLTKGKIDED